MTDPTEKRVIQEIIAVGRSLGSRNLLPASSGNLSARVGDNHIAITRSGCEKSELTEQDVAVIAIDQPPPPGTSAETGLHLLQYRQWPQTGAVLHIHSLAATVVSDHFRDQGQVILRGYELQKAVHDTKTHDTDTILPIFANSQDIAALADTVLAGLAATPNAGGYLLAAHGLYAWGKTVAEAQRTVIALEFLLNCELEKLKIAQAQGATP